MREKSADRPATEQVTAHIAANDDNAWYGWPKDDAYDTLRAKWADSKRSNLWRRQERRPPGELLPTDRRLRIPRPRAFEPRIFVDVLKFQVVAYLAGNLLVL